jgi:serine/threonine protein kinase
MDYTNLCPGCMEDKGPVPACPYCGYEERSSGPASPHHLPPGTILQGKYLLGRALGQGGFGITYLGWDLKLSVKLAIKEYFPQGLAARVPGSSDLDSSSDEIKSQLIFGLERFLSEAKTLARFNEYPGIVSVRDYFEANGTAYLVMTYHEGITLHAYLANMGGRINTDQALKIFIPVLDALKEVHAAGILHRDISPDNLLINDRGQVVLIDFGAARQAMGEKSQSLSVIMKAGYTPLEQYQSRGKQGPWTDIYAVAASFYRVITGTSLPEAFDRLDDDPLVKPTALGVKIAPRQEQVLLKALAVRSKDRFQTVEEFQEAFTVAEKSSAAQVSKEKPSPVIEEEPAMRQAAGTLRDDASSTISNKAIKYAAVFTACGLLLYGGIRLFGSGSETIMQEIEQIEQAEPEQAEPQEEAVAEDPAIIAALDTVYAIDYENGTIPMADLPIGARVVDPSWEWEFRIGDNYSDLDWGGNPTAPGEVKPVTWIVVAIDHYEGLEAHVTMLSEDLIGRYTFDNSTGRGHEDDQYGYSHWGDNGAANATLGLRPWLNSNGIHAGEGFYHAFSESFRGAILTTKLPNRDWKNGSSYSTSDMVFIPSSTELGDSEHNDTYQIGEAYSYFAGAADEARISMIVGDSWRELVEKAFPGYLQEWEVIGNQWFYWTRSPSLFSGDRVRLVSDCGKFYSYSASTGGDGVRPALNLKAEIMVSEIMN